MTRSGKWTRNSLVLWLGVLALVWPAVADVQDFKLAGAVPSDAALVVLSREHAGQAFLKAQLQRVWEKVEQQHFEKDVRTLLKGLMEQEGGDLDAFEQRWQQFNDLLLGVEWSTLAEKELGLAMKLGFPTPELVVIGLSTPEKAKSNFAGLEAILKTTLGFAPEGELVLTPQGEGDSVVLRVNVANSPFPLGFIIAREKDAILLGFGQTLPEQALALLRGEGGEKLVASERFQAAFKRLPPPSDVLFFFDLSRWLGQVRTMIGQGMAMGDPTGQETDPKIKALPGKAIDTCDIFEYLASTTSTNGMKTTSDFVGLLRPDAKTRPLYKVVFGNGTLAQPFKFIPEGAQNMSVWSGFSLPALYDAIIAFVRDEVPDGPDLLARWEQTKAEMKQEAGIDFEPDVLGWIGGGISSFSMPGKSEYSPGASVFMLSVKDEAKAREMLGRLLAALEPFLTQNNGLIDDAKIEGAEGFKVIVHPMLAMIPGFAQPTLGVKDGQLFLGSSLKAVGVALDAAAGKSPNFGSNQRFLKEGLPLEKNLISVGFTDMTNMGRELGAMLKMVPMIGMFAPQIAQHPVGKAVMSVAGKLGNVVQELNFYQSSFSETTLDGDTLYTKSILNYREPPKEPVTTAPAESESGGKTP